MDPVACSKASARVLGIEELLARILNLLPLADLVKSQRVCRAWQATAKSTALQRSLFHEPESSIQERYVYDAEEQMITKHRCPTQQPTGRNPLKQTCIVNELMFQQPTVHQVWATPEEMSSDSVESSILHLNPDLNIYSFSKPPLLDMFLTQPPIKKAQIMWSYGAGARVDDIWNPNGLRGRDIFDSVPASRYPMSMWSAVDQIKLEKCHLRVDLNWYKPVQWIAVSLKEREMLDAMPEGERMALSREKMYFTP